MPNAKNRNIDTPHDDGAGEIVLEVHISPENLTELRDVLYEGSTHKPSLIASQFLAGFDKILKHTENTINNLDREFYEDFMSRIGPKTIN
jgi:hypothetical protein